MAENEYWAGADIPACDFAGYPLNIRTCFARYSNNTNTKCMKLDDKVISIEKPKKSQKALRLSTWIGDQRIMVYVKRPIFHTRT